MSNAHKTTLPSYEARCLRVIDYIYQNLDGDLSLDALADVAAMSRFHWHRVFSAMMGRTAVQWVRITRLHRAACLLRQSDIGVAQIGASVGYPDVASFTRAFGQEYGTSPLAFRTRGLDPDDLPGPTFGDPLMFDITVETHPARRLAALPHSGAYLGIGECFQKIAAMLVSRGKFDRLNSMMGLYYDDPGSVAEADLRSYAAFPLNEGEEVPEGLEEVLVEPGAYAVLDHIGPYSHLKEAYDDLYGRYIPQSELELRDAPALEMYMNGPQDTAPEALHTRICAPLSKTVS